VIIAAMRAKARATAWSRSLPRTLLAAVLGLMLPLGAVATSPAGTAAAGTAAAGTAAAGAAAGQTTSDTLRVGAQSLHRCRIGAGRPTWCGSLRVALDPADRAAGQIGIGFAWLPAKDGRSDRTVVAQEGGPGYPSTGTAASFDAMLGPLARSRNLLLVDARGTGRSTPLDCKALHALPQPPAPAAFQGAVAACGRQLNRTFPRRGGGFVHASDLFSTASSARDLAQVLASLGTGPVDLYGDSYGTYLAQSFMARYPGLVRSMVLDSAYEARGLDPWYRTSVSTARSSFRAVCLRSAACRRANGGSAGLSWQRIGRLAAALRSRPVTGEAVGTDARRARVTVGVTALVNLVNDAGYDYEPYRQLDAAARAYLDHRDPAPLLRLYAQDVGYDYSDYQAEATSYSDGLYLAVACTDYPQLFSTRSAPADRRDQLARAVRALPADTFAPFSIAEWLTVQPFTETYTGCLRWPSPTHEPDPAVPVGAAMNPRQVPVLILNGELDSLTPPTGGAHVARQLGRSARAVVAQNMVHLVGLDDRYGCGQSLVRHFWQAPGRLASLDVACATRIPEVRSVGTFPSTLTIASVGPGSSDLRRLATVATQAAGDAVVRYGYVDGSGDLGLRGGRVRYRESAGGRLTATLAGVRWTSETRLSGRVLVAADGRHVTARLSITPAGRRAVSFTVSWLVGSRNGRAVAVHAGTAIRLPAP
jgi:pimeloyl-ACP methyl ester carboxylesterase